MTLKEFFSFSWLRSLFTKDRLDWAKQMLPYAVKAGEVLTGIDWNQDGLVAGREKLTLLLQLAPPAVRAWLADRGLYSLDGTLYKINWAAVEHMIGPHLKQTLVLVSFVSKLAAAGIALPGWGLVETTIQMAYEQWQANTKT